MPSVRGRRRLLVGTIFWSAGTLSAALVGLVAAIMAAALTGLFNGQPSISGPGLMLLIGAGIALDLIGLRWGYPAPPASGRQVPQEWGRLLPAPVVATLYGARLGIGPLTMLSTWTWWSMTIGAALLGAVPSIIVGATFGMIRQSITIAASLAATATAASSDSASDKATAHADWFGRLRRRKRSNWLAINGLGALALACFAIAGCSGGSADSEQAEANRVSPDSAASSDHADSGQADSDQADSNRTAPFDQTPTATVTVPGDGWGTGSTVAPPISINPAQLEDFVRTATENDLAAATVADDQPTISYSSAPQDLAAALTESIDGFEPIDEPMADRYLDIDAASNLQPDPSEEIALLETRRFQGGWTRAFRNQHNDVAVASVYQFEDAAAAEFYLEDGLITIGGYGGKFFDLEGLPGVRGFVQNFSETDAAGTEELVSLGAAFQVGPRWYLVYFVGSTETVTPEILIPTITAQRQRA